MAPVLPIFQRMSPHVSFPIRKMSLQPLSSPASASTEAPHPLPPPPITSNIHEYQGQHSGNTASLHIQKPRTSTTAFRKVRVTPPPFPSNIQEHQHRVTPAPFTVKIQEHQEHHSGDTAALHNENPSTSTSGNTAALHIENSRTSTATFRKTRVTLPPFTSKIH